MPRKKSKHPPRPEAAICKGCGSSFERTRATKLFCQPKCSATQRMARYRAAKKPTQNRRYNKKIEKFLRTSFARWLIAELKRARTVQVLSGHTADSLDELFRLERQRCKDSGYEAGKPTGAYHLGHIFPVKGKTKMGLLHPKNLVITPAKINTARKAEEPTRPDAGLFLQRTELLDYWNVEMDQTKKQILCQVKSFLGIEWKTFVASIALQQSQIDVLTKKLKKQGLHVHASASLDELKFMADSHGVGYFSPSWFPNEEAEVALREMDRFGCANDRRYATLKQFNDRLNDFQTSIEEGEIIRFTLNLITRDCFDFLNGDNTSAIYEENLGVLAPLGASQSGCSLIACDLADAL